MKMGEIFGLEKKIFTTEPIFNRFMLCLGPNRGTSL